MTTALDHRDALEVGPGWSWLSADGSRRAPASMDTRHLFNTVVMIWNHGMPAAAATHDYRRYRFNPKTHGPAYLRQAISLMLPELMKRDDLTPLQRSRIAFMHAYCVKRPDLLPAPLPALTFEGPLP